MAGDTGTMSPRDREWDKRTIAIACFSLALSNVQAKDAEATEVQIIAERRHQQSIQVVSIAPRDPCDARPQC